MAGHKPQASLWLVASKRGNCDLRAWLYVGTSERVLVSWTMDVSVTKPNHYISNLRGLRPLPPPPPPRAGTAARIRRNSGIFNAKEEVEHI